MGKSSQYVFWWVLGIAVIGILLRAYLLTSRSLWFDEAFSWRLIQFPWLEMIGRAASDVHPPLYYMLLKLWSMVFGTSLFTLRFFSVFLAGVTIALGYVFSAEAFRSRTTGLVSAALLAVSGFQIQYAWEARMYTLGTALALLSSWFLIRAIRSKGIWNWVYYGVITAIFAYIHYYAFFTIGAQMIFIVGTLLVTTRGRVGELLQSNILWGAGLAGMVGLVLYAPWIPTFLSQNAQVQDTFWIPKIGGWSIPDTFYRMFVPTPGIPRHLGVGWIALAAFPISATIIGWGLVVTFVAKRSKSIDGAWLTIILGAAPFIISILFSLAGQSLYQDRFFVFAHLFIVIALAAIISNISRIFWRSIAITAAIIGFIAASGSLWLQLDIAGTPGAQAAARHVLTSVDRDEGVIVSSPFVYFAIDYYAREEYGGQVPVRLYSDTGELSHFAGGPILTAADLVGPEIFDNPNVSTIWVVDTSGFGGSKLKMPSDWKLLTTFSYKEVFDYQGDVFVSEYRRL